MSFFVHDTALIDEGATIGEGTKIWHYSHVMGSSEIGRGCILGQNTFVASKVRIGDGCKVQNNVSLYEGVILEKDVFVGPSVVFTNVNNPRSFIERKLEYLPTVVKEGVSIGANVTVVCGVTLGEYSFIGAGTTVTKDTLPFGLYYGSPMKRQGWVSRSGNKLSFDNNGIAKCLDTGEKYQLVNDNLEFSE